MISLSAALLAGCAAKSQTARAPVSGSAAVLQVAEQAASIGLDPVAAKLAAWLRLQMPDAASASEIAGFLQANPDWPGRGLLNQRLQQALAKEPDDVIARALCSAHRPNTSATLLRCAIALMPAREIPRPILIPGPIPIPGPILTPGPMLAPGLKPAGTPDMATAAGSSSLSALLPEASMPATWTLPLKPALLPTSIVSASRTAWINGIDDSTQEADFLRLFEAVLTPVDQWQRFDRLEWSGATQAARRQIPRLSPADRPLAITRVALRQGDSGADGLAASLRGPSATDPALLLDLARWFRRHDRGADALALWHGKASVAEIAAPEARRSGFWKEREVLARDLLSQRHDADALFLVEDSLQDTGPATGTTRLDADFLAGWILLQRLHAAPDAARKFASLTTQSHSTITSSRGFYWIGRALDAQGNNAGAREAYAQAALRPTSFYGQAAIRRLFPGDGQALSIRIGSLHDPAWTRSQAIGFAGMELARAATLLVAWNDPHHARSFLLRLDELADTDSSHALGASFANRLGLPDVAVAIARSAGRHGLVLAASGWPAPYTPPSDPALPQGLALAVMRQESSFDPGIVSPAGAHGLMQLMPATARIVLGGRTNAGMLSDPSANMAVGTAYLATLLARFGDTVPYAVAAYNAGPNRVPQWLQENGDPAAARNLGHGRTQDQGQEPDDAMIDWIELIPYAETRNYVERVIESQAIYRIRAGVPFSLRIIPGRAAL